MEKYNLYIDADDRKKLERDMKATGHSKIAPFVRMLIRMWPFKDGKAHSDTDMKTFARQWALAKGASNVLEHEEDVLDRELENFKRTR